MPEKYQHQADKVAVGKKEIIYLDKKLVALLTLMMVCFLLATEKAEAAGANCADTIPILRGSSEYTDRENPLTRATSVLIFSNKFKAGASLIHYDDKIQLVTIGHVARSAQASPSLMWVVDTDLCIELNGENFQPLDDKEDGVVIYEFPETFEEELVEAEKTGLLQIPEPKPPMRFGKKMTVYIQDPPSPTGNYYDVMGDGYEPNDIYVQNLDPEAEICQRMSGLPVLMFLEEPDEKPVIVGIIQSITTYNSRELGDGRLCSPIANIALLP